LYGLGGNRQRDSNVTRQQLHTLWIAAQAVSETNLIGLRSGLLPNQIVEIERALAVERHAKLCVGNAIGLGVALGLNDDEIADKLPELVADCAATAIRSDVRRLVKSIQRARTRLHFIGGREIPPV